MSCPGDRTSALEGLASHEECDCATGFYASTSTYIEGTQSCLACPTPGATCPQGRLPEVIEGFWHDPRTTSALTPVLPCQPADACVGGALFGNSTARCSLLWLEAAGGGGSSDPGCAPLDASVLCAQGYAGARCSSCVKGFYRLNGACARCSPQHGLVVGGMVAGVVAAGVLLVVVIRSGMSLAPLTIGMDYFQVLARVASVRARWSGRAVSLLRWSSAFELDVELLAPECFVKADFFNVWTSMMAMPLVAGAGLVIVHVILSLRGELAERIRVGNGCRRRQAWREIVEDQTRRLLSEILLLLQVVYVQLSVRALSALDCTPLADGTAVLDASPNVRCWEGPHKALIPRAIVAIAVYVLGVPLLFALVLRWVRKTARKEGGARSAAEKGVAAELGGGSGEPLPAQRAARRSWHHGSLSSSGATPASSDGPTSTELRRVQQLAEYRVDRRPDPNQTVSTAAANVLSGRFTPEHRWWILVLMARKVALAVVTVYSSTRPGLQLSGFAVVLMLSLFAHIRSQPYSLDQDRKGSRTRLRMLSVLNNPNVMEDACLGASLAVVAAAQVYYTSWASGLEGYPVPSQGLLGVDACLGVVVAVSTMFVFALLGEAVRDRCRAVLGKRKASVAVKQSL